MNFTFFSIGCTVYFFARHLEKKIKATSLRLFNYPCSKWVGIAVSNFKQIGFSVCFPSNLFSITTYMQAHFQLRLLVRSTAVVIFAQSSVNATNCMHGSLLSVMMFCSLVLLEGHEFDLRGQWTSIVPDCEAVSKDSQALPPDASWI